MTGNACIPVPDRRLPQANAEGVVAPARIRRTAKAARLPEDWSVHRDNRLRDTGGTYANIAALSDEWHIAEQVLLARWLRIRDGRVARRSDAPEDPAWRALVGAVSPRVVQILDEIRRRDRVTAVEIAERLGISREAVTSALNQNRVRIEAVGWRLDKVRPAVSRGVAYRLRWGGGAVPAAPEGLSARAVAEALPAQPRALFLHLVKSAPASAPDIAATLGRAPGQISKSLRLLDRRLRLLGWGVTTSRAGKNQFFYSVGPVK